MAWRLAIGVIGVTLMSGAAIARDAKHPDFSGLWTNATLTEFERPDDFKTLIISDEAASTYEKAHRGKVPEGPKDDTIGAFESEWWETNVGLTRIDGRARSSIVTFPEDGQLPTNAAAKAARKKQNAKRKAGFDNPENLTTSERCLSAGAAGPPMIGSGFNDNYKIVQTSDQLAIYAEQGFAVRIIRLGDAPHPPFNQRFRMGDSVGHWEGATLVIETTNFVADEVDSPDGDPKADARVVERMTRLSSGEIHYAFQVEDPASFTQAWRGEQLLHPTNGPIYEYACHEGNYSLPNMLQASRAADGQATAAGTSAVAK